MKAARKMNIGFWIPKKDQCNLCAAYAFGNCEEEEYVTHLRRKEEARAEKTKDKRSCEDDSTVLVVCMDLQVVLLAPSLLANASYFKTKLCCHNFTLYDLARHDVSCYFWDETRGDVSSNCFASCICDFISNVIASQAVDTVILYSDGCGYQNRNVTLSNSLLHLAMTKQLTIYQKFLEKGHTFMEVDSVHSAIERKLRGRQIYWPADYIEVMESARTTKAPYVVKNLDYSFFKDFSGLKYYRSIRPGNSVGEPQVTYIRALLYTADGQISYKLHLSDSWSPLPRRPNRGGAAPLTQLYTQLRPIKLTKFRDLQQLKHVIPREYHEFYNSLPHQ
ncbi:hypothetical protein V1264_001435 [Littorina saxatilis]|uniref:DUF7869 domain-containing protein n=1 Tax=Littorina saxatilis TaxID=31220 RepID=A0AAN9C1G2_9CAEN